MELRRRPRHGVVRCGTVRGGEGRGWGGGNGYVRMGVVGSSRQVPVVTVAGVRKERERLERSNAYSSSNNSEWWFCHQHQLSNTR